MSVIKTEEGETIRTTVISRGASGGDVLLAHVSDDYGSASSFALTPVELALLIANLQAHQADLAGSVHG